MLLVVNLPAAIISFSADLSQGQYVSGAPPGSPPGGGGGQDSSNTGTVGTGNGTDGPLAPQGQSVLKYEEVTGNWTLSGNYRNVAGNLLGVELLGPAGIGQIALLPLLYSFSIPVDPINPSLFQGTGSFTPMQTADLKNGLLYLTITSSQSSSIRGQLLPVPEVEVASLLLVSLLGMSRRSRRTNRIF